MAAEEEAAQAAEADRVQVLEPTVPPTSVRSVDELRNRRSTFIFPHYAVPAATFPNVFTGRVFYTVARRGPGAGSLGRFGFGARAGGFLRMFLRHTGAHASSG